MTLKTDFFVSSCILLCAVGGLPADEPSPTASAPERTRDSGHAESSALKDDRAKSLFDGKTLDGWKPSDYAGAGEPRAEDGLLILPAGVDLTGVTATQKLPRVDYEVALDAQRVDGSDFFCGLTFPVGDEFCSLIVGGWGGGVIGLSSLNGQDASENETTKYQRFEKGRWYPIKLRVTAQRVTAWIDGEKLIDQDIRKRKLTTRIEVAPSKPFGFASWQTTAALRNIRLRELPAEEAKTANAELEDE